MAGKVRPNPEKLAWNAYISAKFYFASYKEVKRQTDELLGLFSTKTPWVYFSIDVNNELHFV